MLRTSNTWRLTRFSNSGGIVPVNPLLPLRYSFWRLVKSPSSSGISPLNSFSLRYRLWRLLKSPNSAGISPVNLFLWRYSHSRLVKFPSSAGIPPSNSFSLRIRRVTDHTSAGRARSGNTKKPLPRLAFLIRLQKLALVIARYRSVSHLGLSGNGEKAQ